MKPCFKPKFVANVQSAAAETEGAGKTPKAVAPRNNSVSQENGTGLSETQYEDIFVSVLARAAAGDLKVPKLNENVSPSQAAGSFSERIQNLSPTTVQAGNEVTPTTSPPEESCKQNLLKPVKDKSKKKPDTFHKRKSLEYKSACKSSVKRKERHTSKKDAMHETNKENMPKKKYLMMGVWVQCGSKDCLKWRFLEDCIDPSELPETWTCSMNKDPEQNHCFDPEVDWSSSVRDSQDHYVYTEFNAGSIVWAKMPGYPPWPAMVDSDPDENMFYEYDERGIVLRYHVVFLDDNVSRAWIPAKNVESYAQNPFKPNNSLREYRLQWENAVSTANTAMHMNVEKRLKKYGFEARFDPASHKSGDWMPKRSKKSISKTSKRKDHVVPDISTNSNKPETRKDEKNASYWDNATEDDMEVPVLPADQSCKRDESPKTAVEAVMLKLNHQDGADKETTKPVDKTVCPSNNKTPVPKPRKKPCFTAPSRSSKQHQSYDIVPKSAESSPDGKLTIGDEMENRGPLLLDSEIFTMEIKNASKDALSQKLERSDDVGSPILCGSHEDTEEPMDLSLKSGSQINSSPNAKSSDMSGKDFWVTPQNKEGKRVPGDKTDDPFLGGNLEDLADERSELLDEFDDCKLQQLDEWMPAITD